MNYLTRSIWMPKDGIERVKATLAYPMFGQNAYDFIFIEMLLIHSLGFKNYLR